ncbi:MAG: cytochrome [Solirubrobacteraceae bacterium]|nr:cytochrome [Solirubrobacteraceae bacterium]
MSEALQVPAHVPQELVRDFQLDFHGPLEELFPRFDALHDEGRVLYVTGAMQAAAEAYGGGGPAGVWVFTQAEDIRAALQAADLFSSDTAAPDAPDTGLPKMIPIFLDPPDHGKYRRILTPLFAPATVAHMEASIRERAIGLVEEMLAKGSCDYVKEFAIEFPTRVFTSWIGLPEEETGRFVTLTDTLIHGGDPAARDAAMAGAFEVLSTLIMARMESPTDDLMSQIVVQEVDGRPLTFEELFNMAFLLFLAGLDTVAAALSFSYWHLAQTPKDRQELVNGTVDPVHAVEELLRRHSFVSLMRRATRDASFAGVDIREGDIIMCSLPLASRDPGEYADATEVDLHRENVRHYAFGAGPHRCVGSHLARLEMRIAFEEWHKRIPDYELGGPAEAYGGGVMGVSSLPLRWASPGS